MNADDAREALAAAMYRADMQRDDWNPMRGVSESYGDHLRENYRTQAQKIIDYGFEVRPSGTVTDAEVEAGAWALLDRGMDLADRSPSQQVFEEAKADARAALEAAREARS